MTKSTLFILAIAILLILAVVFALFTTTNGTSLSNQENPLTSSSEEGEDSNAVASNNTGDTVLATENSPSFVVPNFLTRSFPNTDFSTANEQIANALSGGPQKDGIPALTNPNFVPISQFSRSDTIQAIVMEDGENVKVYPYNIMTWHEIVNDTVGGVPVAITFCPLCGSAIVFDRQLANGETTFGVSGGLVESNMIMYDRATESLWQQSTGEALAGRYVGTKLDLVNFQLLTIGEVRELYPEALVLSEDTGYRRSYDRNPYSGYDTNHDQLVFGVSEYGNEFNTKDIMVVFRIGETVATTRWSDLEQGETAATVADTDITLTREKGELTITTSTGENIPFYFEMWFSVSVQHGEDLAVI